MAKQGWTIRGRVLVRHELQELTDTYGAISPLTGMRVRVQARERIAGTWGSWKSWGQVMVQEEDGSFEISKVKSANNRRFRVQVQFKNADLVIFGANRSLIRQASRLLRLTVVTTLLKEVLLDQILQHFTRLPYQSPWHTIHVDRMRQGREHGMIDLPNMTFQRTAAEDLGDEIARRHADLWFLYNRVRELFDDIGPDYGFKKRIAVKYPHNNPLIGNGIETSYASPENYLIYMVRNRDTDDYQMGFLLHELMHIWAYQHSRREKGLAWQLIVHRDTHDLQERTWVAFHEGFAEYAYHQVYRRLFGKNPRYDLAGSPPPEIEPVPLSRNRLTSNVYNIVTLDDMERHDWGWVSAFNLLTTPRIIRYTFNRPPFTDWHVQIRYRRRANMICDDPSMGFGDVLRLFLTDNSAGLAKQLRRSEMNFERFFARAIAVVPQFDAAARDAFLRLLDPADTTEPRDLLCREPE
jgi:hypothetical protein